MRTSLMPGLLRNVQLNDAHKCTPVRLFEIGRVFEGVEGQLPNEYWRLGLAARHDIHFYGFKAVVEAVCNACGVQPTYQACGPDYLHPGRRANIMMGETPIGWMGELHPSLAADFTHKDRAYFAGLDVDVLVAAPKKALRCKALPRTPAVERDLALVVAETVAAGDLLDTLRRAAGAKLVYIRPFDVYCGPPLNAGEKSIAFACAWQDDAAALTAEVLQPVIEKMIRSAGKVFGARLRE